MIESGVRAHTTRYERDKQPAPSVSLGVGEVSSLVSSSTQVFALKLRRAIRNKRLSSLVQLDIDRVIVVSFGEGETKVKLVLEFYAAGRLSLSRFLTLSTLLLFAPGNIILLDANNVILAILRPYSINNRDVVVSSLYALQALKHHTPLSLDRVVALVGFGDNNNNNVNNNKTLLELLGRVSDAGVGIVLVVVVVVCLLPSV